VKIKHREGGRKRETSKKEEEGRTRGGGKVAKDSDDPLLFSAGSLV